MLVEPGPRVDRQMPGLPVRSPQVEASMAPATSCFISRKRICRWRAASMSSTDSPPGWPTMKGVPASLNAATSASTEQISFICLAVIGDRDGAFLVLRNDFHVAAGTNVTRRQCIAQQIVDQRPGRAVLVVLTCGKGGAGAIVRDTFCYPDADVWIDGDTGTPQRDEQRTLRHNPSAAGL